LRKEPVQKSENRYNLSVFRPRISQGSIRRAAEGSPGDAEPAMNAGMNAERVHMDVIIRKYRSDDLKEMTEIWNEL
jgi:hypothetical protein